MTDSDRRMYWVQNGDPEGNFGDYKGYVQSSWDEAVSVAGELISGGAWDDGYESVEVLELLVVRSEIIKAPEVPEEDDE